MGRIRICGNEWVREIHCVFGPQAVIHVDVVDELRKMPFQAVLLIVCLKNKRLLAHSQSPVSNTSIEGERKTLLRRKLDGKMENNCLLIHVQDLRFAENAGSGGRNSLSMSVVHILL